MFESTSLNARNRQVEGLVKILFLLMTLLLVLPVLLILATLVYKGHSAISLEFLFTFPRDGMTAGGIFPALVGTIWLVAVALLEHCNCCARSTGHSRCDEKVNLCQ